MSTPGMKWCTACKREHPVAAFGRDRSRGDGLDATCRTAKSARPHGGRGATPTPKVQRLAHRRVQKRVERGTMPHANTLPCSRCGHVYDPDEIPVRRHEYHHPNGYAGDAALDVVPYCTLCHHDVHKELAA